MRATPAALSVYEPSAHTYSATPRSTATRRDERTRLKSCCMSLSQHHAKARRQPFHIPCKSLINCGRQRGKSLPFATSPCAKGLRWVMLSNGRPTLAVCAYSRLLQALLKAPAKHSTDWVRLENSSLTASLKAPRVRPPTR